MQMLREFHTVFGQPVFDRAQVIPTVDASLRIELLVEEFSEYLQAEDACNIVEIADALGDMMYVICGTALCYGIDLDAVFTEIHRSNMSKVPPDGVVQRRADGKILKGPTYEPPNIARVLRLEE